MPLLKQKRSVVAVEALRRSSRGFMQNLVVDSPLKNHVRFVRSWLDRPLMTGAVYPSGKVLARAMAAEIDPTTPGLVLELGPGTGPVTDAIIMRGFAEERLVMIEFNPDFCILLRKRFPRALVIEGDAYNLKKTLEQNSLHFKEPITALVSSLPLFTQPPNRRLALMREAFALMPQGSPFVQFTYATTSPVSLRDGEFSARISRRIWRNFPPASVWTYRQVFPSLV